MAWTPASVRPAPLWGYRSPHQETARRRYGITSSGYRGDAVSLTNNQAAVTAGGAYTLLKSKEEWYFVYNSKDAAPKNIKNKILYFIQECVEPPSIAGSIYLLHDPLDYTLERRRVWVVDSSLKKGKKHLYPRRTFYLDEDSWQILIIDIYDTKGDLWRVSEGHVINYYEVPTIWTTLQVHYDLKSGRYYVSDMDNEERTYDFSIRRSPKDYNPAVLRKLGKR